MQNRTDKNTATPRPTASFSKEALALLGAGTAVRTNALDEVSHAVLFR